MMRELEFKRCVWGAVDIQHRQPLTFICNNVLLTGFWHVSFSLFLHFTMADFILGKNGVPLFLLGSRVLGTS